MTLRNCPCSKGVTRYSNAGTYAHRLNFVLMSAFLNPMLANSHAEKGSKSMTDQNDPLDVIDKFLGALRSELAASPEMTYRIIKALPVDVSFEASEMVNFVNPLEIISQNSEEKAREQLYAFKLPELKKMARRVNLASGPDMAKLSIDDLIDLMISRGKRKIGERTSFS